MAARRRGAGALAVALAVTVGLAGCSDDGDDEETVDATTTTTDTASGDAATTDGPTTDGPTTTGPPAGAAVTATGELTTDADGRLVGTLEVANQGDGPVWLVTGPVGARPSLLVEPRTESVVDVGWLLLVPDPTAGTGGSAPEVTLERLEPGATTTLEAASFPLTPETVGEAPGTYRLCVDVVAPDALAPDADQQADEIAVAVAALGTTTRACGPELPAT